VKDAYSIFERMQSVHAGRQRLCDVLYSACDSRKSRLLQLSARVSCWHTTGPDRQDLATDHCGHESNWTPVCLLRPTSHRVGGERLGSTAKLIRVKWKLPIYSPATSRCYAVLCLACVHADCTSTFARINMQTTRFP